MESKQRIIIVGGVAGGASAAARARRLSEGAEILLIERGEHISFANCGLPYHIGGQIQDRNRLLVQTPESMKARFAMDVRIRSEVTQVDPKARTVTIMDLAKGQAYEETYDALILSPGASPVRPGLPGADLPCVLTLRTLNDMDAIKTLVDREGSKQAVVIGGGYIGLEMAEALVECGLKVSLVELAPQVMGPMDPEMASPVHQELALHGVELHLGASVTEIQDRAPSAVVQTSDGQSLEADLVIMAVGVRPEVSLARAAGLTLGERGGIAVNEFMQTSDPHIYAAGDAVEVQDFVGGFGTLIPLAGPANRQGRIAANHIFGRQTPYKKTQGTAICKVFNLAVACTGLNEKTLTKRGMDFEKVYVHPASHAGYYPGAAQMSLKLLFDPKQGTILGAQAVGTDGVDKRIDVLAVALRAGLTVFDLEDLELCYAPPYGSAKDPVNYAGFVAANVINGDVSLCHVEDMIKPTGLQAVLDVRTPGEVQAGTIAGSVNIPVDDLRKSLEKLDRDKEYLVFCQAGLRGYLACRILTQHGFKARNLSGGYKTYCASTGPIDGPSPLPGKPQNQTEKKGDESVKETDLKIVHHIDATCMQCPGPIMQLKSKIDTMEDGQAVSITASDPAFAADLKGWCHSTGHRLDSVTPKQGQYEAVVVKDQASPMPGAQPTQKNKTIVAFSADFDKAMASFIIANGAAAMGSEVTMFFTFWGINLLRRPNFIDVDKTVIERMFGWMMPRGAEKTTLSKMNMGGAGTAMIKGIMKKKHVQPLSELIQRAKENGVRLVVCTMTMDLMGIKREELIEGVEEGGVAMYLDRAEASNVNLFI
jgi:NADPH-dependent 2,4-dienoyl-CoA reductase/sulfur reductase-like enzyme/peroxiredoxin family protein/rhodanese-related sulfurtransferase/TusA-related sulfurtransferase